MFRLSLLLLFLTTGFSLLAQDRMVTVIPDTTARADTLSKVETFRLTRDLEVVPTRWDTSLTRFHRFEPVYRYYCYPLSLGNIVSPAMSAEFRANQNFPDALFIAPYAPYFPGIHHQPFFRVRHPFTQLTYTSAGQKTNLEQMMDVVHTQNVNEKLNVGLLLNFLAGEGQYSYQKETKKSFGFFSSYTGDRYHMFLTAASGRIDRQENGGISNLNILGVAKPKDLPTFLAQANDAGTRIKYKNLDMIHTWAFGTFQRKDTSGTHAKMGSPDNAWGSLIYRMTFQQYGRSYDDHQPDAGYYRQIYLDSLNTFDTSYFRSWNHELALRFQSNPERKISLGSMAGLRVEMQRYLQNDLPDSIFTSSDTLIDLYTTSRIQNLALLGEVSSALGQAIQWKAEGSFYFRGYKAGNTHLNGLLTTRLGKGKQPVTLQVNGSLDISRPGYWLNHYQSNHFWWDNDFRYQKHVRVAGTFDVPSLRLSLSGSVNLLDQYVYFDSLARPVQEAAPFFVYTSGIEKQFRFWKIRSEHALTLQLSTAPDVVSLPLILYRSSTYFHHTFHFKSTGGNLETQLGIDLYYFSGFDGYGFMPASGIFFRQNNVKTGNYPYLDAFLNVKIKRTRFFLKAEHWNSSFTGYNYIQVVNYPVNPFFLKMGLSWTFYD